MHGRNLQGTIPKTAISRLIQYSNNSNISFDTIQQQQQYLVWYNTATTAISRLIQYSNNSNISFDTIQQQQQFGWEIRTSKNNNHLPSTIVPSPVRNMVPIEDLYSPAMQTPLNPFVFLQHIISDTYKDNILML